MKPDLNHKIELPGREIPSFRTFHAESKGITDNLLIKCWGGLGDQICAEPAIRYSKKLFPNSKITLATHHPELFTHLNFFENVFDLKEVQPVWDRYFVFDTIQNPDRLLWEFLSHMLCHPVDFSSIAMWRLQLPVADREIRLPSNPTPIVKEVLEDKLNRVVIHPGKHWPSKTFPKDWWNELIERFVDKGFTPILIGKDGGNTPQDQTGYVDVESGGCIDLRDKLSVKDFISLLRGCYYLFSNDSSPIHAAAPGEAFIGFVATCKHPDYITHWRGGEWAWRTENFGLDGAWNHIDHSPNKNRKVEIEFLPEGLMEKILPVPGAVVNKYCKIRSMAERTKGFFLD